MNHKWVATIGILTAGVFVYMLFNLLQNPISITAGLFGVLTLLLMGYKNNVRYKIYLQQLINLPLEASAEEEETIHWFENKQSHKHLLSMGKFVLITSLTFLVAGCSGRIMYVEYGLDRMASEDKIKLSQVLSTAPVGRRVSWYNKASNSQYTVKVTDDYRTGGGQDANGDPQVRRCRTYLIDDVYPYNAHPRNRGHRQIEEDACWDPHQQRWYAINGWGPRPFIQIGGPVYRNWRRD